MAAAGRTQSGTQFPTVISQSGELWPEDGEHIPFPLGAQPTPGVNWPPAGFELGSDLSLMPTIELDSDLPPLLDLEWIQGATKHVVPIYLPDKNWTEIDPANTSEGVPEWEAHTWHAQVRNPYIFWQNQTSHWIPAYGFQYEWWRQHSAVAEFNVETSLVQGPQTAPDGSVALSEGQWGTRVDLTIPAWMSERLHPGSWYRWDVLSRSVVPIAQGNEVQQDPEVEFWRRGRCRIVTQWTIAGSNYRT